MPDPAGGSVRSVTGVARQMQTTGVYGGSFYGAGDPIPPVLEGQAIRQWDFPPGVNMVTTPRHTEPFTFRHLRAFANVELVRMAIETRKDQLERLDWMIKPRDNAKARKDAKGERDPRCAEVEKFLAKPDGQTLFQPFFRALEEDLLAIDAPCLERVRNRGGKMIGLELVDGATINLLVDNTGRRPRGDTDIAFQQIVRGMVWANLANRDLFYFPRNVRTGHIYGFSPVEQIVVTINTIIRRQASQLAYFTEGNVPQGIIGAPENWTLSQIREIQEWFDQKISGNAGQQRSAIWVPFGSKYEAFKDSPIKDEFDEWLARLVSNAFSLPPTPFIRQMNKGTAGEDQERALEEGLEPLKKWRKRLIDQLIAEEFGYDDLEFAFKVETEIDPKIQSDADDKAIRNGSTTIDEVRDMRGLDPLENGLGAKPRIYMAGSVIPLEIVDKAAEKDLAAPVVAPGQLAAAPGTAPGKPPAKGGKPAPADEKKKPDASASGTTKLGKYSDDQPRDEHGRWAGGGGGHAQELGLVDSSGAVTDKGLAVFSSNWIGGNWGIYQKVAESEIKGQSKEDFAAQYQDKEGALAARDLVAGVMNKINNSDPLAYPLYRGLVGVHYEVGDTFSESLSTWTSNESLARDFAHDAFHTAGTDGTAEGIVFKVAGSEMHGVNITDINPNYSAEDPMLQNAAEHITSGQYRVTSVEGEGTKRTYNVTRIGNAQASDLKKVIPVELEKYSPDQPRDERGRWTDGGGGGGSSSGSSSGAGDAGGIHEDNRLNDNAGTFPVQQLTDEQLREAFGILATDTHPLHDGRTAPTGETAQELSEWNETLDAAEWEGTGLDGKPDYRPDQSVMRYSDSQPRDEHGRWSDGGGADVLFEVSPNPDNKELADRWNALDESARQAITDKISGELTPQVMNAIGASGTVEPALGGFEGEINPSLVMSVNSGDPFKVAGAIGDTFGQKAMVVMSDTAREGLSPVGMVAVNVGDADVGALSGIQGKIGDLADGFTYRDGQMQILNFSGKSDEEFATDIDNRLEGAYLVEHATVYSAYIEASNYDRPENDSQGAPWKETARALREAFSQRLGQALSEATGKVAKYSPDQPRDERGRFGEGGGGGHFETELTTDELMPTMDRMAAEPDVHQNIIGLTVNGEAIFNPDSEKGIPRERMPQIPSESRDAFLSNYETDVVSVDPTELAPTQAELDSYKVGLSATGKLTSSMPIVSNDGYVIDGHHHWAGSVVRATLDGGERLLVTQVNESRDTLLAAAHSFDSSQGISGESMGVSHKLSKAKTPPKKILGISIDNPLVQKIEAKLYNAFETAFEKAHDYVSKRLSDWWVATAPPGQQPARTDLDDAFHLIDAINLSDILNMHEPLLAGLEDVTLGTIPLALDSVGSAALARIGVEDASLLVDQISEAAVAWAREHAADLLSVDGPDSIIASTRQMVRDVIANALENNVGVEQMKTDLKESMAFSDYRSQLIATTEVAMANSEAKQLTWNALRDKGATMEKRWYASGLEGVCPVCQENEDEGEIDYDGLFTSGDSFEPAHPACRCVVAVRVVNGEE